MSSIIDDLRPSIPKGKFWEALAALRDKDEEGYQAFVNAMWTWSDHKGEWEYRSSELQQALTKHTSIQFNRARITEIRTTHTIEELPV